MIRFTVFDCPKEDVLGVYPRKAHFMNKANKDTFILHPHESLPIVTGIENNAQLEYISKDDCKYCFGRGYER